MRYTPTLKLSTRLVAFVTIIVISAMFILFVGGTYSFQRLGQEYLNHYLEGMVDVLDKEMDDPDEVYSMQRWMPQMLQASNIVEMELSSKAGVIYRFKDTSNKVSPERLYQQTLPLKRHNGYHVKFKVVPPYNGYSYSMGAMWSITLAVAFIVFCLVQGVKWLKEQLMGSELLEERGRMILAGQVERFAKGDEREWPYTASEALDLLIEELQDARQERSRFDTFIRSQTFLDQLTGAANRVLFDNKLEATLQESGAHGGVIMLRIDEIEAAKEENDKQSVNNLIVDVGQCLSNVLSRYPDVILSRYYESIFAVFLPHQASKDVAYAASQCLKLVERITPPSPLDKDNWFHIGVTMYTEGERRGRIINEVETALKNAQLQGINSWSRFKKLSKPQDERGSVRWRTLFDEALKPNNILLYQQPCYVLTDNGDLHVEHREVFSRIDDPQQGVIKASRFSAALEMVGYEPFMDRSVFSRILEFLQHNSSKDHYSLNLHVLPFADRRYVRWFKFELMQLPLDMRRRLSFEFSEGHLVQHLDYMRPVLRMISGLGYKVVVGQAGRTIVSTHYLKDIKVDFIKLHRSLIKRIDQRHENQLFVRSMLGVCSGSETKVIAVGVEEESEWKMLQTLGVNGVQGRLFDEERPLIPGKLKKRKMESLVKPGRRNRWRTK
ncbi:MULTISPECIES: RNase E specificity factor CsrD [Vibrio]|uniref:RNase E specificity factor CsrD n=2 Tax=Vibrio TaxID=662 RepID=A0A7X4RTY7_9VIBR|nr:MULTISPECIES: RNase E specificity factor CsrD [Vibrio]MBF9001345.1 RNase E specificity factor CsrD [Vibrio nitrifigilis]MZI92740.1 RNase E specificity factor CsrD [Vibrio eleionomae]